MPFAIDPVCGKVVDPNVSDLKIAANGISFPFCSEKCAKEFTRNQLDYLYCPWKPKEKVSSEFHADVYGQTIYFCCADCRNHAIAFVAV